MVKNMSHNERWETPNYARLPPDYYDKQARQEIDEAVAMSSLLRSPIFLLLVAFFWTWGFAQWFGVEKQFLAILHGATHYAGIAFWFWLAFYLGKKILRAYRRMRGLFLIR